MKVSFEKMNITVGWQESLAFWQRQ